jgi:hypothetical protein
MDNINIKVMIYILEFVLMFTALNKIIVLIISIEILRRSFEINFPSAVKSCSGSLLWCQLILFES